MRRISFVRLLLLTLLLFGCTLGWIYTQILFQQKEPDSIQQHVTPRVKAVIYFLVQGTSKSLSNMQNILWELDRHFNQFYNYPIIIFSDNLTTTYVETLRSSTSSMLQFEQVSFDFPDGVVESQFPGFNQTGCPKDYMGYRHMCRFQAYTVHQHPALDAYEFYWRLDDDSRILDYIKFDIFEFMQNKNFTYGFAYSTEELNMPCIEGLHLLTESYIAARGIEPTFYFDLPQTVYFGNNFEIGRQDFWRSENYKDFFSVIDASMGIYHHRWGDAPIKTVALSLFVPPHKLHHFDYVAYAHQKALNTAAWAWFREQQKPGGSFGPPVASAET